jgi:hypothetical protein
MKPRASMLRIRPAKCETLELELHDPGTTEVPAKTVATDLCPPMIMSLPAASQFECFRSAEDTRGDRPRSTDFEIQRFDLEMRNYV